MSIFLSPSVVTREIDLSDAVANIATAIGGIVVRSKRGSLFPKLITNTKQYKENYCLNTRSIDSSLLEGYAAVSYLEYKGASLIVQRVVSQEATFGGVTLAASGTSGTNSGLPSGLSLNDEKTGAVTYSFGVDESLLIIADNPGNWNNNLAVKISGHDFSDNTFLIQIYEVINKNEILRENHRVSKNPDALDGYGRNIFIEKVFENSPYITVINNPAVSGMPKPQTELLFFTKGDDGDTITVGEIANAWEVFENVDNLNVSLLIQGGLGDESIQLKMVSIADKRKDCIAILDAPENITETLSIINWRKHVLNIDSSYAMLVAPWLHVYDWDNDKKIYIPPSGVVAGLAARNDYYTYPWYAFSGVNRGVVEILGLKAYYNKEDRDMLSPAGINVFRKKPGQFALWDNKTLQVKESALSYIEIRRLLIVLKKSINDMAESFLFEPLTDTTRQRLVAVIDNYLMTVRANHGLYSYKIVCDKLGDPNGNNPSHNIDMGQLNCDIYLKPVHAIRYILLSAVVMRHGASFEEKITLTV